MCKNWRLCSFDLLVVSSNHHSRTKFASSYRAECTPCRRTYAASNASLLCIVSRRAEASCDRLRLRRSSGGPIKMQQGMQKNTARPRTTRRSIRLRCDSAGSLYVDAALDVEGDGRNGASARCQRRSRIFLRVLEMQTHRRHGHPNETIIKVKSHLIQGLELFDFGSPSLDDLLEPGFEGCGLLP